MAGEGENICDQHFLLFPHCFLPNLKGIHVFNFHLFCHLQILSILTGIKTAGWVYVYPVPDIQSLGSLNSVANKDMISKIWTSGDTII